MSIRGQFETADSRTFWEGAGKGKLLFQSCTQCHHVQYPPRFQCAKCWCDALDDFQSSGQGTIESLTVVRRAPLAAFRSKVPYVVIAAIMPEGPRMIANLLGEGALSAKPGDAVEVCFVPDDGGTVLPQFTLRAG